VSTSSVITFWRCSAFFLLKQNNITICQHKAVTQTVQ
jgi:hypothetical protein